MALITLRVLDGADRGHVYDQIPTPITIGREEGNKVQLNDERISRFHVKIQEDQDKVVLTDLESTNGTRINGEETQLRLLRFGDVIHVGRSVLLYGTREQIADRLGTLRANGLAADDELDVEKLARKTDSDSSVSNLDMEWGDSENLRSTLHIPTAPEVPEGLSPAQAAQISEILEYLHLRCRGLLQGVRMSEEETEVRLNLEEWQELLDIHSLLSEYLKKIGNPGE